VGRRPRLLYIVDDDSYFCSHRLDLARTARDSGFEVSVGTLVQRHAKQIEKEEFTLLPIRLRRGIQSPLYELGSLVELIRLYRRVRPDIIHHVALKQIMFGATAARLARVPAIVNAVTGLGYMNNGDSSRRRLLRVGVKPVLRWAMGHPRSVVIFQNTEDCKDFVEAGLVRMSQALIIRGAGVNTSDFSPSPQPDGEPVVVLASRMLRDKGVGEFLEAARLLKQEGVRARLALVGAVDRENPSTYTEIELRRWQAEGIVEWWGHQDDMAKIFAGSHIAVLPSYGEGLPKVLLEAAACARPLVATRVRGCREIVRDGENGLLVPPRDPQALAQALRTLIYDRALRDRMGLRGREIVVKEFDARHVAEETISAYQWLLGDGRNTASISDYHDAVYGTGTYGRSDPAPFIHDHR
jgi:glycosyltransferase involved in cell wall biosynthesis